MSTKKVDEQMINIQNKNSSYFVEWMRENQLIDLVQLIQQGDEVHKECGGDQIGSKGFFIQPTAFSNVKDDMAIAQDAIFGPTGPIYLEMEAS